MTKCKKCGYEFEDEDIAIDAAHGGPLCTECNDESLNEIEENKHNEYNSEQAYMDAENPNYR